MTAKYILLPLLFILLAGAPSSLLATDLPPEFEDIVVLDGLRDPSTIAFAPDGRLFYCERISGRLRTASYDVVTDAWTTHPAPFYTFDVPPNRHRSGGLRGIAFDPDYLANGYIYAFYTKNNPRHNRVVRIRTDPNDPNRALAGSEELLIDLPFSATVSSGSHNGGDLRFGADGKLYISTGDGWNGGANVQSLTTLTGKMLRIDPDGTIPSDNPFYTQTTGYYRAIYALGLRNPYTISFRPLDGNLYINEARGTKKADIYRLAPAANFGHDGYNGLGTDADPWANASGTGGKLITGGAWYPAGGPWPATYHGNYLVALWGGNGSNTDGRIVRVVDDGGGSPQTLPFADNVFRNPGRHKPVMTRIGLDGHLYYLLTDYETGDAEIHAIRYTGVAATPTPILTPGPGSYDDPIMLTVATAGAPSATIYYTTDGSIPNTSSPEYTGPLTLTETTVLRAIAVADGLAPSGVSGGQYQIGPVPNLPPVADAGPDLAAAVNTNITLNGSASYDPDGSPLEIVEDWEQIAGPLTSIFDADETVANFTPTATGTYQFRITITDVNGAVDTDEATITVVEQINDITDGLIARWRMEEGIGPTVIDYGPQANNGIAVGEPTYSTQTPDGSNYALTFDGVDDRVDLGTLDLSGTAVTFTAWVYPTDLGVPDARIISKAFGQYDEEHFWMLSALDRDILRCRLRTNGQTTTIVSDPGTLVSGRWQHVAATYDGAMLELYVDGQLVASTPLTGRLDSDPQVNAALGNQPATATGGDRPWYGQLDEVRIYDRALTPAELDVVRGAVVLPVVWGDLSATAIGQYVDLHWSTSAEYGSRGFYIERSLDGRFFREIGFRESSGPTGERSYTWRDLKPAAGLNIYRLRQVDTDGTVSYSPIVQARVAEEQAAAIIYPNPARSTARVRSTNNTPVKKVVVYVSGRIVWSGSGQEDIPVGNWPASMYVAEMVLSDGRRLWCRLVVR